MTTIEWNGKLAIACSEHYKQFNTWPQAIYMGYEEDMDYRANTPPSNLIGSFQGVEIIVVCKESYFRVI